MALDTALHMSRRGRGSVKRCILRVVRACPSGRGAMALDTARLEGKLRACPRRGNGPRYGFSEGDTGPSIRLSGGGRLELGLGGLGLG